MSIIIIIIISIIRRRPWRWEEASSEAKTVDFVGAIGTRRNVTPFGGPACKKTTKHNIISVGKAHGQRDRRRAPRAEEALAI